MLPQPQLPRAETERAFQIVFFGACQSYISAASRPKGETRLESFVVGENTSQSFADGGLKQDQVETVGWWWCYGIGPFIPPQSSIVHEPPCRWRAAHPSPFSSPAPLRFNNGRVTRRLFMLASIQRYKGVDTRE